MGPVAAAVPYIGPALMIMGALTGKSGATQAANQQTAYANLGAASAIEQGDAQRAEAEYEAAQLRVNAGQQRAAAQRAAVEQRRVGTVLDSRINAVAAASGGGAGDVSVVMYRATMAGDTAYKAALKVYAGEETARGMEAQADATRYSGYMAQKGAYGRAAGYDIQGKSAQISGQAQGNSALLNGFGGLFTRYGMGGAGSAATGTGAVASAGASEAILDAGITPMTAMT